MSLTVGSLFAGIGGFDLGFERAGFEIKWQVEIDPFCRKVLEKHWPHVRRYEDVRTVGDELERTDVITGGFPCQDIIFAGEGAGISGERSGLWTEMVRVVRMVRPDYVIVENVAALLNRGMGRVCGDLAALGFCVEWDCLPAASFGAPHIRDRIFVLAHTRGKFGDVRPCSEYACHILVQQGNNREEEKRGIHRKLARMVPGVHPRAHENWWRTQSRVDRSTNGLPNRMDRLRGCGNAIVPQIAQWIAERIKEAEGVSGRSQVSG